MKRVIALSLLLLAFVCSLHSVDVLIDDVWFSDYLENPLYEITLINEPSSIFKETFIFSIRNDRALCSVPEYYLSENVSITVPSSDIAPINLRVNDTGQGSAYNAIADDPKSVLDFIKVFLEDSFIVLDISSKDYSDRVCWYVPTSLENSRIDTLMKLEIFEKYFFQRTNQE